MGGFRLCAIVHLFGEWKMDWNKASDSLTPRLFCSADGPVEVVSIIGACRSRRSSIPCAKRR
eukprot:11626251-Prorocentrum_lima.AAC.1